MTDRSVVIGRERDRLEIGDGRRDITKPPSMERSPGFRLRKPPERTRPGSRDGRIGRGGRSDGGRIINRRGSTLIDRTDRGTELRRPRRTSRIVYEDRTRLIRHRRHHEHVYRDRFGRFCHRVIRPRYYFPVCYNWGPRVVVHYVYPYYHRRYIFVSLGGYWPVHYTYARYYWYPSHFYSWYGYHPVAREIRSDTYNYYTYNYYYGDGGAAEGYTQSASALGTVDHTTFADVREKLARQQAQGPGAETLADQYFDEAVKAFEAGDYATAAEKFAEAMELAPEDAILPFAYAQALFANGQYEQAAEALRRALEKSSPDEEGVFYPRGLYLDEEALLEQIDRLAEQAALWPNNSDLQLLLGYHYLGIGEMEKSLEPLRNARRDYKNFAAASVLLELAEKIQEESTEQSEPKTPEAIKDED